MKTKLLCLLLTVLLVIGMLPTGVMAAESSTFQVNAPADADVRVDILGDDLNMLSIYPDTEAPQSDGTVDYTFNTAYTDQMTYHVGGEDYVKYVGSVAPSDTARVVVTKEMLQPAGKSASTIDRDTASNDGANVGDIYLNINEQGYLSLNTNDTYQIVAKRNWWGSNDTWVLSGTYYRAEPDFNYTVLDLEGNASSDVVTIDDTGLLTAKSNGTAIVLVTYDAMTLEYHEEAKTSYDSYDPNGFFGASWPERTGVFVVSVGQGLTAIFPNMTIHEELNAQSSKIAGAYVDAELDMFYFLGTQGEYTFTPETPNATVSVANPTLDNDKLGYDGFTPVEAVDGSFTVPLTEGRNIVKIDANGKSEYQVISADGITATVNGEDLDTAILAPGDPVSLTYDTIFNPANRMSAYNTDAAPMYHTISGIEGAKAGGVRGSYGYYFFGSDATKQTIYRFVSDAKDDWGNTQLQPGEDLTVPTDYALDEFVLSDGTFNVAGFGLDYGFHRNPYQIEGLAENTMAYLGVMPDISIPVATMTGIRVEKQPTKTEYSKGDSFDATGMTVLAVYETASGTELTREITDYTYPTNALATFGDQDITISYTKDETTYGTDVSITVLEESITAYVSIVDATGAIATGKDGTAMWNVPVVVTKNNDGLYTMAQALISAHASYHPEGASGYIGDTWITKIWGTETGDCGVALNNSYCLGVNTEIDENDLVSVFVYQGELWDDLYTYFSQDTYETMPNEACSFQTNGINLMVSTEETLATAYPVGATVSAYNSAKELVATTTVDETGSFTLTFPTTDTYTLEVSGLCSYTAPDWYGNPMEYHDAHAVPSLCKVLVGAKTLHALEITKQPDKTFYEIGEAFDPTGLEVMAVYTCSDDTTIKEAFVDFTYDTNVFSTAGNQTVVLSHTVDGITKTVDVAVTVIDNTPAPPSVTPEKTITAYVTIVDEDGSIATGKDGTTMWNVPVEVTKTDDGIYTMAQALIAAHEDYHPAGKTGYKGDDWITKVWGVETANCGVALNNSWCMGVGTEIQEDDLVSIFIYQDLIFYNDLYTYFAKDSYKATVSTPYAFQVEGINLMNSSPDADSLAYPTGATVTAYDSKMNAVDTTTVAEDGTFTFTFSATGSYTIEVSGTSTYTTSGYNGVLLECKDAFVVPGRCQVVVSKVSSSSTPDGEEILPETETTSSNPYVDVSTEDWFYDSVLTLRESDLMIGTEESTFSPQETTTRAMLMTVLARHANVDITDGATWYTKAMDWAMEIGISDGTNPTAPLTREQMVTMLWRYAGSPTTTQVLTAFDDADTVSAYAKTAMEWAVDNGIIQGVTTTTLSPTATATRAQFAVILQRYLDLAK